MATQTKPRKRSATTKAPSRRTAIRMTCRKAEADPYGKDQHEAGAKLDAGKVRLGLVLSGFPRALKAVGAVGTYGAAKYTDNGWKEVPDGAARYTDALYRHMMDEAAGERNDLESNILHSAHAAWNALARLELYLLEQESDAVQ